MRLIVISAPSHVKGEEKLVSGMVHAGLDTFHLRRPSWTSKQHREYLETYSADIRRRIVVHHAHELVQPSQLKVNMSLVRTDQQRTIGKHFAVNFFSRLQGYHFTVKSRPVLPFLAPEKHTASLSLHTLSELELPLQGMEYAFLSPIFDSISKAGYNAAFEPKSLQSAVQSARCPIIALGGNNVPSILPFECFQIHCS